MTSTLDALVVGAGPSGLAMASELVRHGCSCRIIDKDPSPSDKSKALGIHARTLELFYDLGILEEVLDKSLKLPAVNMHSEGRTVARLSFAGIPSPYPFAVSLQQSETERILTEHLSTQGLQPERQVELLGFTQVRDGIKAKLQHFGGQEEACRSRWIVGCDGAHSTVRHLLAIPFEGEAYENTWSLADLRVDWPLPKDEIHIFLNPSGILAYFPMPGERDRFVYNNLATSRKISDPTLADFQQEIVKRSQQAVRVNDPGWITNFRLHHRKATTFHRGRAFLVGDAGHVHSPAGGQGMNTGIQDAYNLAWKMALVRAGKSPESLLDSYDPERSPIAATVLKETDMLTRLVELRSPLLRKVRNLVMPVVTRTRRFRNLMPPQMAQLNFNYRKSPIVGEDWTGESARATAAGNRAPDSILVSGSDGREVSLFEVFRGPNHKVLLFSGHDARPATISPLLEISRQASRKLSKLMKVVFVVGQDPVPKDSVPKDSGWDGLEILVDPQHKCHIEYGSSDPCLYLIRPDKYIGYRARPVQWESFETYLRRIFVLDSR